jgi:hypothetical protein
MMNKYEYEYEQSSDNTAICEILTKNQNIRSKLLSYSNMHYIYAIHI